VGAAASGPAIGATPRIGGGSVRCRLRTLAGAAGRVPGTGAVSEGTEADTASAAPVLPPYRVSGDTRPGVACPSTWMLMPLTPRVLDPLPTRRMDPVAACDWSSHPGSPTGAMMPLPPDARGIPGAPGIAGSCRIDTLCACVAGTGTDTMSSRELVLDAADELGMEMTWAPEVARLRCSVLHAAAAASYSRASAT